MCVQQPEKMRGRKLAKIKREEMKCLQENYLLPLIRYQNVNNSMINWSQGMRERKRKKERNEIFLLLLRLLIRNERGRKFLFLES